MNKPQKRDWQQMRQIVSGLSKQVAGKVTFEQTERLMIRFQKQIFVKLNEERGQWQEVEVRLNKALSNNNSDICQKLDEINKARTAGVKLQKKTKKYLEEMAYVRSDLQKLKTDIAGNLNQCSLNHKHQLDDIEMIQGLVQKMADREGLLSEDLMQTDSQECLLVSSPVTTKNGQVVWEKRIGGQKDKYDFEGGKTSVRVVNAGFYEVVCGVFGNASKKAPVLMCNGQILARLQGTSGGEGLAKWSVRQWIHIRQGRSSLSLKYQGDEAHSCTLLSIRCLTS